MRILACGMGCMRRSTAVCAVNALGAGQAKLAQRSLGQAMRMTTRRAGTPPKRRAVDG